MRETRPSGSEGGGPQLNAAFLPLSNGKPRPLKRTLLVSPIHFSPRAFPSVGS